ncbi:MAG: hypothetical protein ABFS32_15000 [Bacteroidota bacterium]
MKKFSIMLLAILGMAVTSCDEESDPIFDRPSITAPTGTQVQVGNSVDMSFTIDAPGKIGEVSVSASAGSATVDGSSLVGETSATATVSLTAPASAGNLTVTLTVKDQQSSAKTESATATVEVTTTPPPPANEVVSGAITSNTTWTSDRIWELASKVVVEDGATLTIEPGTIVKGRTGAGSLATALIVARGGMIDAQGTAAAPIIFTSIEDNIEVGELAGTNLTEEDKDKWGGVIILGKAPISAENGDTETQIEGIPPEDTFGLYGGSDATDNSGTMKYVSIRHGGAEIGAGNEINGLTLGGVGNGTTLDHIEIFATLDDGIEFFGGTVNVTNLIISYQGDDGVDIDQNYSGTVDNFMVLHGGSDTDEGLEIDGPEGSTYTDGKFTLTNGTVMTLGGADEGTPADLKSKAQGTIDNVIFSAYSSGNLKIRASYQNDCADAKTDAYTHLIAGDLALITSKFDGVSVYTKSVAADGTTSCSVKAADQTAAEGAAVSSDSATGASSSEFDNWTLASIKGLY